MRAVVLAAGLGTRFKSDVPKVLHTILGKPMVWYVIREIKSTGIRDIGVVVGHQAQKVMQALEGENLLFYHQKNPKGGTADAVLASLDLWRDYEGYILIANGDAPLITHETLKQMIRFLTLVQEYENVKLSAVLLSASLPDPTGYGRIVKDEKGNVVKIVEEREADFQEKQIREVNGGIYLFYAPHLFETIFHVKPSPNTGEAYLTEVIRLMVERGYTVKSFMASDPTEVMGVNDRWELSIAENVIRLRILREWAQRGVTFHQPESIWIEPSVELEKDVEVYPNVSLKGNTKIGKGAVIGNGCIVENSQVGKGARIEPYSVIKNSHVEDGAVVGPFAHVREESFIGSGSHVGNFVEVKKSKLGQDVKAKHLAYIGDAFIGDNTNVGAGTVFANFDGKRKHQTFVGKNVFIGSNSLLIAPLKIEDFAFIAGGSVITKDVQEGDLAISRPKLRIIKGKGKEKLA